MRIREIVRYLLTPEDTSCEGMHDCPSEMAGHLKLLLWMGAAVLTGVAMARIF